MQALLVLAALLARTAAAAKAAQAGSQGQAQASDREGGRLVRSEAAVINAGAEVLLDLDSHDLSSRIAANCSMANVFGPDSKVWPTTVAQAKNIQLAYCMMRGYSNSTCTSVIDEHFTNHSLTQGSDNLTMTPRFCEESVLLLSLDLVHSGNSSANVQLLLESSARSTLGGEGQFWPFTNPSCSGKCDNNQEMVYHSWSVGCVCAWCETNTWSQVQLCRRKCYVGDSPGCAQCFPSSAAVSVLTPGGAVATRAMEDLRVGDFVQTAGGFSKVFAFMDHVSDTEAEYVQLKTASGYELSLTADHMVYAHAEQTPVLAGTILEGDLLWTASGVAAGFVPSRVVKVQHGLERGMHAPLTEEGSVVVNGGRPLVELREGQEPALGLLGPRERPRHQQVHARAPAPCVQPGAPPVRARVALGGGAPRVDPVPSGQVRVAAGHEQRAQRHSLRPGRGALRLLLACQLRPDRCRSPALGGVRPGVPRHPAGPRRGISRGRAAQGRG